MTITPACSVREPDGAQGLLCAADLAVQLGHAVTWIGQDDEHHGYVVLDGIHVEHDGAYVLVPDLELLELYANQRPVWQDDRKLRRMFHETGREVLVWEVGSMHELERHDLDWQSPGVSPTWERRDDDGR